jgi:hypothetical protein
VLGLPAWQDVQIDVVAENGGSDYRVLLVLAGEQIEGAEGLAIDHGSFFNPADLVLLGLYLQKAVAAPKHLERLAVHHLSYAIRDGGYPVMQVGLPDRNVDCFVPLMAETRAPASKHKKTQHEKQG